VTGSAQAGFGPIAINDDEFAPEVVSNESLGGGQFNWQWGTVFDKHNVRQDNKLFRSGPPTDDDDATFGSIELPAGRYHYYCENHGTKNGGMDGLIGIHPTVGVQTDDYVPVEWAFDNPIRVGNRWDVRYRIGSGKWKTWLKGAKKLEGKFGHNDKPVNFNPNRTYSVSVKTKLASDPSRQSKFSPAESFGAP
jgi:hypothetical protein